VGVHVRVFAARAGLTRGEIASLTHGSADDPCWAGPRERALIRVTDSLHDHADVGDDLWPAAREAFDDAQLLPDAPRFADFAEVDR
jgi:hypothetical protein